MSSILKALEKVDESQRSRRPAGTGGLPRGRARRPAWVIPAWALGGAAVAALATYALMGGFSKPAAQVAQKGSETAAVAPAKPLAAPAEAPTALQAQPAAKEVLAPAQPVAASAAKPSVAAKPAPANAVAKQTAQPLTQAAAKATAKVALPLQPNVNAAARQLAQPMAKAAISPVAAPQLAPVRQAPVQPAPAVAASVPAAAPAAQKSRPEIRVTGIAWQNNSESSFAMVNGKPMRQGNMVDGYKIEQIYEDSVRFTSSKGNSLVVPLGAGEE